MKKNKVGIFIFMMSVLVFIGCSKTEIKIETKTEIKIETEKETETKEIVYDASTGEKIKFVLDTTDGFDLTKDIPFAISHDGEEITFGKFIPSVDYDGYVEVVHRSMECELIKEGEKDGNAYIHWIYDGIEFNYAIKVEGTNTAIIMSNFLSLESAKESFQRLSVYGHIEDK